MGMMGYRLFCDYFSNRSFKLNTVECHISGAFQADDTDVTSDTHYLEELISAGMWLF